MVIYATPTELAHYINPDADPTPDPPALATVLLRSASQLVASAIAGAVYPSAAGLPTDADKLQAVKDATCEQAMAWSLSGVDPRTGTAGLKPLVTTKSLGGASVSYGQAAGVQDALERLWSGKVLVDSAWAILDNAGLLSNRAATNDWGREYYLTPRSPFALGEGTLGG